jgi:hypothetical protein
VDFGGLRMSATRWREGWSSEKGLGIMIAAWPKGLPVSAKKFHQNFRFSFQSQLRLSGGTFQLTP